jgi:hypothetical protein
MWCLLHGVYESIWAAANVRYKLHISAFGAVGAKSRTGDLRCSAIYMKSRYALPSSAGVSEKRTAYIYQKR